MVISKNRFMTNTVLTTDYRFKSNILFMLPIIILSNKIQLVSLKDATRYHGQ